MKGLRYIALYLFIALMLIPDIAVGAHVQKNPKRSGLPVPLVYPGDKDRLSILVEKSTQRLFIYNGNYEVIKSFKITTGKNIGNKLRQGDKRTPEGIYFFTDVLEKEKLQPEYGIMALPLNYPNPIDLENNRRGNGIWLHATDHSNRLLKPYDTKGCIVTLNDNVLRIAQYVELQSTPIVILNKINPINSEGMSELRQTLMASIEGWRTAWEDKNIDAYISYYSRSFHSDKMNLRQWTQYKERLFEGYKNIKVEIKDLRIFRNDDYVLASFIQEYQSDHHADVGIKRIYLTEDDKKWKIVAEEWLALPDKNPALIAGKYTKFERRTDYGPIASRTVFDMSPSHRHGGMEGTKVKDEELTASNEVVSVKKVEQSVNKPVPIQKTTAPDTSTISGRIEELKKSVRPQELQAAEPDIARNIEPPARSVSPEEPLAAPADKNPVTDNPVDTMSRSQSDAVSKTGDKIAIEDFSVVSQKRVKVRFKLINKLSSDTKLIGRIAIIAKGHDYMKKPLVTSYPSLKIRDDKPLDFKEGEYYAIKSFKIVTGDFKEFGRKNNSISSFSVYIYSSTGETLLHKEFKNGDG